MTSVQTANEIEKRVRLSEFASSVHWSSSQFMDLGDSVFIEIVLKDAALIPVVRQLLTRVSTELNVRFDFIVRAKWEILEIADPVQSYSEKGSPRTAIDFPVVLKSGSVKLPIAVAVTYIAQKRLEELHKTSTLVFLKDLVRDYINLQLSLGGTSYWDAQRYPYLEINDAAVSYLLSRGIVQAIKEKAII